MAIAHRDLTQPRSRAIMLGGRAALPGDRCLGTLEAAFSRLEGFTVLRKSWPVVISTALLLTGLGLCAREIRSSCWWGDEVCPGIRLGGQTLGPGADADALLGEKARELSARSVSVTVDGVPDAERTLTFGELGVVLD